MAEWSYVTSKIKLLKIVTSVLFFLFSVFCFVLFFRATLVAYGSSKARGRIRATAARLCHSNMACEPCPQPHHSSQQPWIPNLLSKARDQSCILMDTSHINFCCTTMGTPSLSLSQVIHSGETSCYVLSKPLGGPASRELRTQTNSPWVSSEANSLAHAFRCF